LAHYIFVHGGLHDAWCWHALRDELHRRGHRTWATDLPCDDLGAGTEVYARTVVEDCDQADDDAIVVGHSLGGLTIPLVALARPVGRLVFLSAGVPEPGTSFSEQLTRYDSAPDPFPGLDEQGRLVYDAITAGEVFYHDCAPAVAEAAIARLRPQSLLPMTEITPVTDWPGQPCTTIHGHGDRLIPVSYAQRASASLGSKLVLVEGGHSLFLSRPGEVADLLDSLAG
jgi:pimeloyl-ACP methyl ester carboxylesterase